MMFAIITPALITGAFAERIKFSSMLVPRTVAHVPRQFIAQQQQRPPIEIGEYQIRPQLALPVHFLQRSAVEFEIGLKPVLCSIVSRAIHRDRIAFHPQGRGCPEPQCGHRQNAAPRPHIQYGLAAVHEIFKPFQQHPCRRVVARAECLLWIENNFNIAGLQIGRLPARSNHNPTSNTKWLHRFSPLLIPILVRKGLHQNVGP
jgi:hypothetical protein